MQSISLVLLNGIILSDWWSKGISHLCPVETMALRCLLFRDQCYFNLKDCKVFIKEFVKGFKSIRKQISQLLTVNKLSIYLKSYTQFCIKYKLSAVSAHKSQNLHIGPSLILHVQILNS